VSKAAAVDIFHRRADFSQSENDCWLWTGHIQTNGYGSILAGERYLVHRLSYELAKGEIPVGLEVMHLCNRRACYNWRHLMLGSHRKNMEHTRIRPELLRPAISELAKQVMANRREHDRRAKKSTEMTHNPQPLLSDAVTDTKQGQ